MEDITHHVSAVFFNNNELMIPITISEEVFDFAVDILSSS